MTDAKRVWMGVQGSYRWMEIQPSYRLDELLALLPALVLGHQVAVMAFDASPFKPTPQESSDGWTLAGEVAVSPPVSDVETLPNAEWDEWYIDAQPSLMLGMEMFVNTLGFSLQPTAHVSHTEVIERFWHQFQRIQPRTMMFSNDARCVVVTSDAQVFRALTQLVRPPDV